MTRLAKKVLLVGWDAAEWAIIRPLVDQGQLPNLSRLIHDGVSGDLHSLQPMLSPMLWTSIATGKRPHKHGIHGFIEPRPDGQGIRAAASTSRTTKALWNILTQCGLSTHNVAWYASHPAEPIRGVSVSNHFSIVPGASQPWTLSQGTVHPPELSNTLADLRLRPEQIRLRDLQSFLPNLRQIGQTQDPRLYQCAIMLMRRTLRSQPAREFLSPVFPATTTTTAQSMPPTTWRGATAVHWRTKATCLAQ